MFKSATYEIHSSFQQPLTLYRGGFGSPERTADNLIEVIRKARRSNPDVDAIRADPLGEPLFTREDDCWSGLGWPDTQYSGPRKYREPNAG